MYYCELQIPPPTKFKAQIINPFISNLLDAKCVSIV